jgi:hypothetical protein
VLDEKCLCDLDCKYVIFGLVELFFFNVTSNCDVREFRLRILNGGDLNNVYVNVVT